MIVLGHRGGRGEGWPAENSLAAFARALEEGADGVELDVRRCASGEVVVLHDTTLARVTGGRDRRRVARVPRRELPRLEGGEPIADLAEALDLLNGRIVNVEVKADAPLRFLLVREVVRIVARARPVEVILSSFDPGVVLTLAVAAPRAGHGMLVGRRTPRLRTVLPRAIRRAIDAAHLEAPLVDAPTVDRLRASGLPVTSWTVNDPAEARAHRDLGVTTIITDDPRTISAALR